MLSLLVALSLAFASEPATPTSRPLVAFDAVVTASSPHYDLEAIYHEGRYDEGLELTKARIAAHPEDSELYVHAIRFMFEIGERFERTDAKVDKKAWYNDMIGYAEQGLEVKPGDPHLLYGYALSKARLGTTRGVLSSLFMAKEVEDVWLSVVSSGYRYSSLGGEEMLPCDAHLTLGVFYRLVPDSGIVKFLSGTRGDLLKSLGHLQSADACYPDRMGVVKELGVTQLCLGDKEKDPAMTARGIATLERATQIVPGAATDYTDIRHAKMLIADPSLACEYSRDGQQELDEEIDEEKAMGGSASP